MLSVTKLIKPKRLYPSLKRSKKQVKMQSSSSSSSDDESGDSGLDPTAICIAPMSIKESKPKGQDEAKVTIKYQPLSPKQVDKMAKDFKHPREMGMGPFQT